MQLLKIQQIAALIDTGASVSVINVKTLERLGRRGQPCELYECKGITFNAIDGNKLDILGRNNFTGLHW